MVIEEISFSRFRNLEDMTLSFSEKVNVFCGENAQGKTNIIEGISVLSGQKSFRTNKDRELVRFGEESAQVTAVFQSGGRENRLTMDIASQRTATLNGLSVPTMGELSQKFSCIVFSPAHLTLVRDGPEKRRKFLDACLCRISPKYTQMINDYERVLFQRNSLVRDLKYSPYRQERMENELAVWDISLANLGCMIHNMRKKYLKRLTEKAAVFYSGISDGEESFSSEYLSTVFDCGESADPKEQREIYYRRLCESADEDIKQGFTGIGVQRDDFNLFIDGKNARIYGSQGQQRSCVLALKISECEILEEAFGEVPAVLLDDVMSELDRKRQLFLMNCLDGRQIFITCCEINDIKHLSEGLIFTVKDGQITRRRTKKKKGESDVSSRGKRCGDQ